jgi:hypothetical protein
VVGYNYYSCVKNSINTGTVSGTELNTGGLAGRNSESSTILNSCNAGKVTGVDHVGGISGANSHATITYCINNGTVLGEDMIGGVSGMNWYYTPISDSYNTGAILGNMYVGGIAGLGNDSASISDSYNTGPVSGVYRIGGITGFNANSSSVLDSFNTGAVSGDYVVGSLIGEYNDGSISNCCWLEGTNENGIGTGSGVTVSSFSHTEPTLAAVYSDMEAIAESAGTDPGAVYNIVFEGDMIPAVFDPLQGAYLFTSGDQDFSVYKISDDVTVTVKIGASLSEVLSGGTTAEPTSPGGRDYELTGLSAGAWVTVKAEYVLQPEKTRLYLFFNRSE